MQSVNLETLSAAGIPLRGIHWPRQEPVAAVCLVHGLGEHTGRYHRWAARLCTAGVAVAGYDLPGFGRSGGIRGHVAGGSSAMLAVVDQTVEDLRRWYGPTVPIILFGQSMGGNLVLRHLLDREGPVQGYIASSPWIRLPRPPGALRVAAARMALRFRPELTQSNGLDVGQLSNDPAIAAAYRSDPLVHDRISVELGWSMLQSARRLDTFRGRIHKPLLLMHGRADQLTDSQASEQLAERTDGPVTLRIWEGLLHELHNEPRAAEVMDFLLEWMSAVTTGA